jgi:hypothetical protein
MIPIKSVRQKYEASDGILRLLVEFRRMINVCIAIGIEEKNFESQDFVDGIVSPT